MSRRPLEAARASGLVRAGEPLLVLLSGGGDSVCLLDVALRLEARVSALHVNYGLRPGADEDEAFVRELCERLRVPLHAERASLGEGGNLQERARELRYALAETVAEGDYAAAHTASDQAETVLYRLAVSPGSRALHGMAPRRGRLVRPLLASTRDEVRAYLSERGLGWREDPSNADRRFARARVRHDLLEALREVGPAPERTIAETARQLREEGELLDEAVSAALEELGGGPAVSLAALGEQPPALRRLVLRRLAEQAAREPIAADEAARDPGAADAARPRALSRREADDILELGDRGTKALDLGGGLRAVAEYGTLRFTRAREEAVPEPVELSVPGRVRFGDWELEAAPAGRGDVSVTGLGPVATVRAWREGDRMRPAGLGGTKTLQDLFTDRKVPRALRRTLPVVEAAGAIVWVAGVAVDERFAAAEGAPDAVGLSCAQVVPNTRSPASPSPGLM
jgi:tRNA(Ile)-lysidine synthase